jgi:carbon-monoxide dehydrogenase medium subunit
VTPFEFRAAGSLDEAIALVKEYGDDAHLIAGGTSLVIMMKQGLVQPRVVVGLRRVGALRGIGPGPNGSLEIGALTTHREVERSAIASSFFAPLCETFGRVATVRIRNQATLGGNLVHADPAQDPPPMLLALDAEILVASDGATRTIPATGFFRDFFETALETGEILTGVRIPALPSGTRGTYVKFLPQTKDDYATVSVACVLRLGEDGTCDDVRIGLGAAGPIPLRARRTEAALRGSRLSRASIEEAAALVREEVDPLDDLRGSASYKREMARVWTERALLKLAGLGDEVAAR